MAYCEQAGEGHSFIAYIEHHNQLQGDWGGRNRSYAAVDVSGVFPGFIFAGFTI